MNIKGINHVVLKVRNLAESDAFYREMLGLELVAKRGRMWFYSAGAHTHDLALIEIGVNGKVPSVDNTGLLHLCFDVKNEEALLRMYKKMRAAGVRVSDGVDHTVMHSFYVHDPDGNMIELGVDVPKEQWEKLPNAWSEDREYDFSGSKA
jgi:catechol 2,3-dioxygenase